jgi:hypothetical protein
MGSSKDLNHDKGVIITLIRLTADSASWNLLQEKTGFSEGYLNYLLYELFKTGEISKNEGIYRYISPELSSKVQELYHRREIENIDLRNKIIKYLEVHDIKTSFEKDHLFLEGSHLDQFTKFILDMAAKEIFVVNPNADESDLSKQLQDAKKRGLDVRLLTRPPNDKQKIACHEKLTNEGVIIINNENVHAKIITIDRKVAIISSMNFISTSSAGKTWEAGIVTVERDIISEINKAILKQMS